MDTIFTSMNHEERFDIPVLMLVFNRPELTQKVLNRILSIRPQKLYVVADGARTGNAKDVVNAQLVRELFDGLPEEIEVVKLFREANLGCKNSVSSGISWFFEHEKMGVILEDDCLPDESFFTFSRELLMHYQDVPEVMHIGGNNFQNGISRTQASYYFSNIPHVWGWATWKRAWDKYDITMSGLDDFARSTSHKDLGWDWYFFYKYLRNFKRTANNEINTWDYQWHFSVWKHKGLSIIPDVNLIENIGFGEDATHTTSSQSYLSKMIAHKMKFPLQHPAELKVIAEADNYSLGLYMGKNWFDRIFRKIKELAG